MGKIKKITENELVGGTQSTDVYPVTSVKAVYDENNERLDNILNRRGVVNISTNYNADHVAEVLTLSQAIAKVPSSDRVLGFRGTYLASDGWHTIIYIGESLITWDTIANWIDFPDKIYKSLSKNATFAGIATPSTNPGTPDGPVFYLATEVGIYPNFNNIEVMKGESAIFIWDNSAWSKKVTGFATQERLTELFQQKVVVSYINEQPSNASEGEFALYIPDMSLRIYKGYGWQLLTDLSPYKEVVVNGINDIYITYKIENNQIVRLCNSYTKANATINGALNNGVIININGFKTTDFISCEGFLTYTWSGYALQSGWNIISFYCSADENSFISGYGSQSAGSITTINIPVPIGAKYFRCTFSNDYTGELTEGLEMFWSKCLLKNNVQYDFAALSFNNIGLLRSNGTLNSAAAGYHTTDYIPCDPKIAQISANIMSVNSADWYGICFYSDNKEESFISGIAATGTATKYNPITIPSGAKYLRIGTSLTYGNAYIKILDIGGFVVTQNQKINELDKTLNKRKKVVCIGDSLTAGVNGSYDSNGNAVSPAVTYEDELQSMLGPGYDVINLGVGGESTNVILGRVGVIPYALSNKVTLPASSASKVAVNIVSSYDFTSQVQPLRQGDAGLRYCFVDNIKCNLTYNSGTYYLNRVEDAVNPSIIGAKTLIIPEAAEKYKDADIVIVWTGSNDGASQSDYQMQIEKFKRVESFYNNATCFFMVQHHGTETSTQDADKAFNSAFGSRFINFRNYASNQGIYDAIDNGWLNKITYKSDDDTSIILSNYSSYLTIVEYSVTDVGSIAVGRTPVSFTNFLRNQEDTLHLNSDGFKTLALLIFNRLKQLNL